MRVLTDPAETGAVTLALPQDVQAEAYDWPEEFFAERVWQVRAAGSRAGRAGAGPRQAIRAARRPLIVAGGGVHHSEAEEALRAFVDATGIPVASTQAGKGSLRHDHPADLGGIGHTGTAVADDLARTADLVIGVGTRYTDFTTASGTLFPTPASASSTSTSPPSTRTSSARSPLVADARAALEALTGALAGTASRRAYEAEYRARQGALGAHGGRGVRPARRWTRTPGPPRPRCSARWTRSSATTDVIINAAGSLPGDLHKLWRARCPAAVPPRVRLLVHGLRDPGRASASGWPPRTARCGRWSATART